MLNKLNKIIVDLYNRNCIIKELSVNSSIPADLYDEIINNFNLKINKVSLGYFRCTIKYINENKELITLFIM